MSTFFILQLGKMLAHYMWARIREWKFDAFSVVGMS